MDYLLKRINQVDDGAGRNPPILQPPWIQRLVYPLLIL